MDIKSLQKSSTFSSFTSGTHKISNWFAALGEYRRKSSMKASKSLTLGVLHENPRIGSDGESEEASGASDDVFSPVKLRPKSRRLSEQDINKRLSLPADLHLPESFVAKQNVSPTIDGPLSRACRRQSLSEIGFGRMETYVKLGPLGQGTYATVFKGKSRLTDKLVALKEIQLELEEGAPCTAIREVSLLKNLRHANIVTLHDIIYTEKSLTLVFEYVDRDLHQYMDENHSVMCSNKVRLFLFQLLRGLSYCHQRRILHRDLKPQNLLVNDKGELKLADFGLARAKSVPTKTYSHEVVTLWYRPPDCLLGSTEYSTQIDMWGVGCIFYEMCNCEPLFPGSTIREQLELILVGKKATDKSPRDKIYEVYDKLCHTAQIPSIPTLSPHRIDKSGIELLGKFLLFDPKKRISAAEAMKHPYFQPLGPAVHELHDEASIYTVPGIKFRVDGPRRVDFPRRAKMKPKRVEDREVREDRRMSHVTEPSELSSVAAR